MTTSSHPSPIERERLKQLAAALEASRRTLRYVDYRQAERDCEALAESLRAELAPEALRAARFEAIPRGGLIVLGLLAYTLGLTPDQLVPASDAASDADTLRILVDDCALTGERLGEALHRISGSGPVVIATLYSHPDLRRALVEREPRVRACLAARDLRDHPPAEGEAWRKRWRERLGSERYWIGNPEWIAFAWSEPDRPFWNPVSKAIEDGWRLLPPHRCLKNRHRLGTSESESSWHLSVGVIHGEFDGVLWLCEPESGDLCSLEGVALEMFRLLLRSGAEEDSIRSLVAQWQVDEAAAREDLLGFAESLRVGGFLVPPGGTP